MAIHNAYILYRKTRGDLPGTITNHAAFRLAVASDLLETTYVSASSPPSSVTSVGRLTGRHFPEHLKNPNKDAKKKKLTHFCAVCTLSTAQRAQLGPAAEKLPKKTYSTYQCAECQVCLCAVPCFAIFHTKENYKQAIIEKLQSGNGLKA